MGKKKTPAVKQKKGVPSLNFRMSTKNVSVGHTDLNGSFIQSAIPIEPDPTVNTRASQPLQIPDKSDSILAMLQKLDESIQALIKQLGDLETQKTVNSTPRETQLQSDVSTLSAHNNLHSLTSTHQNGLQLTAADIQLNTTQLQPPQAAMTTSQLNPGTHSQTFTSGHEHIPGDFGQSFCLQADHGATHFPSDGILPGINMLRQNQSISQ